MKTVVLVSCICLALSACNPKPETPKKASSDSTIQQKDTLTYAYKARYSSNVIVPGGHPEYVQNALQAWKLFETGQIDALKPFFADSITMDNAEGKHFHFSSDSMISMLKNQISGLDSLRFDIDVWENAHVQDKNEDWVNLWVEARAYPKKGKPDTTLFNENWQVKNGKFFYINQYKAKPAR